MKTLIILAAFGLVLATGFRLPFRILKNKEPERTFDREDEKDDYADVYGEEDEKDYEANFDEDEYVEADPLYDRANIVRRSADSYIIRPSGDGMYGPDGEPRVLVG